MNSIVRVRASSSLPPGVQAVAYVPRFPHGRVIVYYDVNLSLAARGKAVRLALRAARRGGRSMPPLLWVPPLAWASAKAASKVTTALTGTAVAATLATGAFLAVPGHHEPPGRLGAASPARHLAQARGQQPQPRTTVSAVPHSTALHGGRPASLGLTPGRLPQIPPAPHPSVLPTTAPGVTLPPLPSPTPGGGSPSPSVSISVSVSASPPLRRDDRGGGDDRRHEPPERVGRPVPTQVLQLLRRDPRCERIPCQLDV